MAEADDQELNDCISVTHFKTRIAMYSHTFIWTTENLSGLFFSTDVESLEFKTAPACSWRATLHVTADKCLFLHFAKTSGPIVQVEHYITVLNGKNEELFKDLRCIEYSTTDKYDILTNLQKEVSKPLLTKDVSKVHGEKIIFKCKMEIIQKDVPTVICELPNKSISKGNSEKLINDLRTMYKTPLHSDVILKVGETSICVHKAILSARSSVFAKMFETEMLESKSSEVDIDGFDVSVIQHFVDFLYTGALIDEAFDAVYSLYCVADIYDVPTLRKTCAGVLVSKLSVKNVCQLMKLADLYDDNELRESTMSFMIFHFEEIVKAGSWESFGVDHAKLAAKIVTASIKKRYSGFVTE